MIIYPIIYLLIDMVTIMRFGHISAQVFVLLSARLAVAVLVMAAVSQYIALSNQRL